MQTSSVEGPRFEVVSALGCEDEASVARRIAAMCAALAASIETAVAA